MLSCLQEEKWVPDEQRPGEIWVRWGCDGVPLWDRSYLTLTCSVGALGPGMPLLSRLETFVTTCFFGDEKDMYGLSFAVPLTK